jgi:uncharacterized protein
MMHTAPEIYTIPFGDKSVIYRPQRHVAFIGNSALARYVLERDSGIAAGADPDIERFLQDAGFDGPALECSLPEIGGEVRPTGAVLLMTNRCNLRCTYCYANAGAEQHPAEMSWSIAKAVIDFVVGNARQAAAEPPSLTFHGGGEPTVHWDLLVRAVEYAKAVDPRTRISMSSNGIWTEAQRRFVCRHFADVSLSMDGVSEVQNRQRPRAGGLESATDVWESIRSLDEAAIDYGIRMTVLPESVDRLVDGVSLICRDTRARAIQVEPTFTSSRGHYADMDGGFADAFSERFVEAWRVGRAANRQVYYSGARPWVIAPMFCQAPLKAAVATADGRLVTCFEVFSELSPLAGGFTVGRVRDGRVEYDGAALRAFLDAQQQRRQECVDCFCYWHCSGDCATRRPGGRNGSEGRCRATRNITLALLLAFMEESGGLWVGLRESLASAPAGCDQADGEPAGEDPMRAR